MCHVKPDVTLFQRIYNRPVLVNHHTQPLPCYLPTQISLPALISNFPYYLKLSRGQWASVEVNGQQDDYLECICAYLMVKLIDMIPWGERIIIRVTLVTRLHWSSCLQRALEKAPLGPLYWKILKCHDL